MSGIKTGNKGFVNPVDNKVYSIVNGEEDPENPINPVSETYDPGNMTVDKTVKDISKTVKTTLANYLSKATLGQAGASTTANAYPIDGSTLSTIESSLTTPTGYPSPLTPASSGNSKKFADQDHQIPSSISDNYAKGTNTEGTITTLLSKGKSEESATKQLLDGNELLRGVTKVQNVVTLPSPLGAYFSAAITPNYRAPTDKFFSESDILNPPKAFNPKLLNYKVSFAPDPGSTTVDSSNLSLRLDKVVTTDTSVFNFASGLTGKNFFSVSAPDPLTLKSITVNEVPPTLATAESQNTKVFASGLRNSYTDDYTDLSVNNKDGLQKGKTEHSIDPTIPKPSGNSFLSKIVIEGTSIKAGTGLDFLKTYTNSAISPNYRNAAGQFTTEDILSPSGKFDYKLIDYSSLQKVEPKTEAVKQGDLTLTLSSIFNFASKLTNPAAGFISLTTSVKNSYPVSAPDKFSADSLYPITTDGFPSPRNVGTNKNTFVFNDNLPSSYSAEFDSVSGQFKKGKQNTSGVDGHALLSKSIITDSFGFTRLNPSLRNYFENVAVVNFFYPDISNSVLSKDSNEKAFLLKQIDISSPPRAFEPIINIGTTFGKYSGQESLKTQWNLIDQRKKASEITQVNQYSVDLSLEDLIHTNDPSTSLPLPLSQKNNDSYVKREDIKPLSRDATIKNFSKGKESLNNDDNVTTGHTLLKDGVPGNYDVLTGLPSNESPTGIEESSPLYEYVGNRGATVLNVGANRFIGSSRPERGFNPTLTLPGGKTISQLKMSNVARELLNRATGRAERSATEVDFAENPVISSPDLGIAKVNNILLEAADAINSLSIDNEIDEGSLTSISGIYDDSGNGQSWGTLTTPDSKFDQPLNTRFIVLMLLLLTAIITLFGFFGFFTPQDKRTSDPLKPSRDPNGQLALGNHKFKSKDDGLFGLGGGVLTIENMLGIRETFNPAISALNAGVKAFFIGASNADVTIAQIAAAVAGIGIDSIVGEGSAVGANIVVARTIVRSSLIIAQQVESIQNANETSLSPALSKVSGIATIGKLFRTSKLISAINVFMSLGDALLSRQSTMVLGPDGSPRTSSGADRQDPLGAHSTVRKSRLTYDDGQGTVKYDPELAWSSRRAPSLYLVPASIAGIQNRDASQGNPLGSFGGSGYLRKHDGTGKSKTISSLAPDSGRFSKEIRESMEKLLDAEYVPFYFHDIRTNEIISFHAFLTSLTDDYTASYDSVEGFGRVEPVKIYKGTQRKISLSFIIASTSEEDFHDMWFKINKLVTLAYPQYTSGRSLVGPGYDFKAPFSQMIGASPLIRIRLGDLLRSNYSRFGLARLFGAGSESTTIPTPATDGSATPSNDSPQQSNAGKNLQALVTVNDATKKFISDLSKTSTQAFADNLRGLSIPYNSSHVAQGITLVDNSNRNNGKTLETVADDDVSNPSYYGKNRAPFRNTTIKVLGVQEFDYLISVEYFNMKLMKMVESRNLITPQQLSVLVNSSIGVKNALNERLNTQPQNVAISGYNSIVSFMQENTNAIVRSFESAGGKGLAGVIESMNFDWYSQTTWEIAPGSTAPKMCKVTVNFSPIHDITPGIDHMGYNRAPVYSVGNAMNSTTPNQVSANTVEKSSK
jgi:hypothetical protein